MIYLDSSALVTLVAERAYSSALRGFLRTHANEKTSVATIGFGAALLEGPLLCELPLVLVVLVGLMR